MSGAIAAFIQNLFGDSTGITALNNTLDQRLTQARANGLDNLVNLSAGPAALHADLGAPTDALTASTAWAVTQEIERLICDIETQVQQLNAGQTGLAIFNINTINSAIVTPPPIGVVGGGGGSTGSTISYPPDSGLSGGIMMQQWVGPGGAVVMVPYTGPNQPSPSANGGYTATGVITFGVANPMSEPSSMPFGTGIPSDNVSGISQTLFSPSLAQQQLTAPSVRLSTAIATPILNTLANTGITTTPTSSTGVGGIFFGTSTALTPISGCGSNLPSGVYVTVNGTNPTLTGDIYPFTLGQVGATPYIGIKRATNNHWYFVAKATTGGSEVTVQIDKIVGGSASGSVNWPVQFYWPGNNAQPALQDALGIIYLLPANSAPAANITLAPVIQVMNDTSGFYHAAVGYV
jgi:hypothetical protein